jgi:hypothetical protein
MNPETQRKINMNRLIARKRILDRHDIIDFSNVPGFIVDAFFGEGTYHTRLLVTTFAHVNGLNEYQIFKLLKWSPVKEKDKQKISNLLVYLQNSENAVNYYSYNVTTKQVLYCNGDLRRYGKRIPRNK